MVNWPFCWYSRGAVSKAHRDGAPVPCFEPPKGPSFWLKKLGRSERPASPVQKGWIAARFLAERLPCSAEKLPLRTKH